MTTAFRLSNSQTRPLGVIDVAWTHRSGPNMLEIYGTEGSFAAGNGEMHFETRKLSDEEKAEYIANAPASSTRTDTTVD